MDTLRLVLILFGLFIIIAIYLYTRISQGLPLFKSRSSKTKIEKPVPEPASLSDEDIAGAIRNKRYASDVPNEDAISQISATLSAGVKNELVNDEIDSLSSYTEDDSTEPLLIVLSIMAKPGELLQGLDILDATLASGFKHGEMDIFHYRDEAANDARAICSLANSIEPGIFVMSNIEEVTTPGLTLFMQLPGPVDGRSAFETTLKLGRSLAEKLHADLCDEKRSVLTMQSIEHLKEKIEAHRFKARMSQIKQHRH